jgi:hypothetical protein
MLSAESELATSLVSETLASEDIEVLVGSATGEDILLNLNRFGDDTKKEKSPCSGDTIFESLELIWLAISRGHEESKMAVG